MTLHEFLNVARKLGFIDRYDVPCLTLGEWGQLSEDPIRFLSQVDDETAQRIWKKIR